MKFKNFRRNAKRQFFDLQKTIELVELAPAEGRKSQKSPEF